jgi:hypothetical protein
MGSRMSQRFVSTICRGCPVLQAVPRLDVAPTELLPILDAVAISISLLRSYAHSLGDAGCE